MAGAGDVKAAECGLEMLGVISTKALSFLSRNRMYIQWSSAWLRESTSSL